MPFPVAAAITAGAGLLGGGMASASQAAANETNVKLAREQMAFQRQMSNTAYQRAVRDLTKAGLNPALAYSQGGASSPGGAQTKVEPTSQMGQAVANAPAYAMQAQMNQANIEAIKAQTAKTSAEANQVGLESLARVALLKSEVLGNRARMGLTGAQATSQLLENKFYRRTFENRAYQSDAIPELTRLLASQERSKAWRMGNENEVFRRTLENIVAQVAADLDATRAGTAQVRTNTRLLGLDIPEAINDARTAGNWWTKHGRPVVQGVGEVLDLIPGYKWSTSRSNSRGNTDWDRRGGQRRDRSSSESRSFQFK